MLSVYCCCWCPCWPTIALGWLRTRRHVPRALPPPPRSGARLQRTVCLITAVHKRTGRPHVVRPALRGKLARKALRGCRLPSVLRTPKRACQRHTVTSLIGSDVRCEDHIWMHGSWQAAVPPVMPPKRRVFINSTQQLIILVQMLSLRANCRFQVRAVVVLSLPALGE